MGTSFGVLLGVALFNFLGSIVQGVAGIGDAIFLQVFWLLACGLWPDTFLTSPLGPAPVSAAALMMYIRLLCMSPMVVYLGLSDSIFSKSMVIAMAVPSTILSVVGVILFKMVDAKALKLFLGYSSLCFAIVCIGILAYRSYKKKKQVAGLKERNITLKTEAEAIQEEVQLSRNASIVGLHASFVMGVPNNSIFSMPSNMNNNNNNGNSGVYSGRDLPLIGAMIPNPSASSPMQFNNGSGVTAQLSGASYTQQGDTIVVQDAPMAALDPVTGLPADTTEAYLDTVGGEVFTAAETVAPRVDAENVPPLTHNKLSPLRTMTFTRVRINRNLDANGKVKLTTKIGAAVAASMAGLMASMTGVNAPPQIIFILLFDAPNYIVRVNFSAQSIPGNVLRFFLAMYNGSFHTDMIPIFLDTIIFGFAGVFVGNSIGRLLGPQSFNIFVLLLLLLCSLAMIVNNYKLLLVCMLVSIVITVVVTYLENKRTKPIVDAQKEAEMEVEKRLYDCFEELQRNNNSFVFPGVLNNNNSSGVGPSLVSPNGLEHMQRATRPKPMWSSNANLDNDDDDEGNEAHLHSSSPQLQYNVTDRDDHNNNNNNDCDDDDYDSEYVGGRSAKAIASTQPPTQVMAARHPNNNKYSDSEYRDSDDEDSITKKKEHNNNNNNNEGEEKEEEKNKNKKEEGVPAGGDGSLTSLRTADSAPHDDEDDENLL